MNDKYCMAKAFINESALPSFSAEEAKEVADVYAGYGGVADGKTGYISVYGALGIGYWDCAFTSYNNIKSSISAMLKNDSVENIVLCINSPGGSASGLFDCCRYIQDACKKKNIVAYVNGMACSAAYAIACACKKITVAEGSEVGCCGCYAHVMEYSEDFYKGEGIQHKIFRSKNAPRKNASVIENEEEAKAFQADIDMLGDQYLEFVAEMRCVPKEEAEENFGKGAVLCDLELAKKCKMIDEIGTLETCVNTLESSLNQEGEGENMDIKAMSAEELLKEMTDEQKASISASLCTPNPSLTEERENEVRKAERERLNGLNALRNGSESIDALVNAAVEDGRDANAIALDVVKAMQGQASTKANEEKAAGIKVLESLAIATEDVNVPSAAITEEQYIEMLAEN